MRLPTAGAAKSRHLRLDHPVFCDCRVILNIFDFLAVPVFGIIPADQRHAVAGLQRGPLIFEGAVNNIGWRKHLHGIGWRVLHDRYRACAPVNDRPKDTGEVLDDLVGVLLALEIEVAGKAWLLTAKAVRDKIVAILADRIELPFVDLRAIDLVAKPVAGVRQKIVEAPGWVVGPCEFECSVPGPGIGSSVRVVVRGDIDHEPLDVEGSGRDRGKLLRVYGDASERGMAVFEFGRDDRGEVIEPEFVLQIGVPGIMGDTRDPHVKGT